MDKLKHMQDSNRRNAIKYDRVNAFVYKGDRERIRQAAADKDISINDMILAALEAYTGLTGLRLKGDKEE